MTMQDTRQKRSDDGAKAKKLRFKIEKLEERIAPHHRVDHVHGPGIHRCNPSVGRCI